MNVGQLIAKLQKLDPETVVAKFHEGAGYDECYFIDGTHTSFNGDSDLLKTNRTKFVKGQSKPDYDSIQLGETRAKTKKFIIIY